MQAPGVPCRTSPGFPDRLSRKSAWSNCGPPGTGHASACGPEQ